MILVRQIIQICLLLLFTKNVVLQTSFDSSFNQNCSNNSIVLKDELKCVSANSKNAILTFLNKTIDQVNGVDQISYILYRNCEKTMVVAKYKSCEGSKNRKCNCAFYLMLNDSRYVFMDFCDSKSIMHSSLLPKYHEAKTSLTALLNCNSFIKDQNDSLGWDSIDSPISGLKCARLKKKCNSYLIRTTNQTNNIQINLDVGCDQKDQQNPLNKIEIIPISPVSSVQTGGICGLLEKDIKNCTNYLYNEKCESNSENIFFNWNIQNIGGVTLGWNFNMNKMQQECILSNKHEEIETFTKTQIKKNLVFESLKNNYILYNDTKNILITAKHDYCNKMNSNKMCACALYIRIDDSDPHYIFLDHCNGNPKAHANGLNYFDNSRVKAVSKGDIKKVDCSRTIYNDNDEKEWNKIPIFEKYFQCARLNSSPCETYVVKATYKNKFVKTKIDIGCNNAINPLSKIVINLEPNTVHQTGGLCGSNVIGYASVDKRQVNFNSTVEVIEVGTTTRAPVSLSDKWRLRKSDFDGWKLDLTQYVTSSLYECNLFNYVNSIQAFNGELLKNKQYIDSEKRNIVLYNFRQDIIISAKFRPCRNSLFNTPMFCICGLYLRLKKDDAQVAFIDICDKRNLRDRPKFQYFNKETHPQQYYEDLDCSKTITDDDDDDKWKSIRVSKNYFQCAKLNNPCESYVIRTVGLDYNVKMKTYLKCDETSPDPFDEVIINPALASERASSGLCGAFSMAKEISSQSECNFLDDNGSCIGYGNIEKIINKWSIKRKAESSLKFKSSKFFEYDYNDNNDNFDDDDDDDIIFFDPNDDIVIIDGSDQIIPPPVVPRNNLTRSTQYCESRNDPHMKSIANRIYDFHRPGAFVLYDMSPNLIVSAGFSSCNGGAMCNCGVFITVNLDIKPKSAFVNYCSEDVFSSMNLGYDGNFYNLDKCTGTPTARNLDDIFNDQFWEERRSFENDFINCVRVGSTYYFRTVNEDDKYVVTVAVTVRGNSIDVVRVYPSRESYTDSGAQQVGLKVWTGGLCGQWAETQVSPQYCDLYYGTGAQTFCVEIGQHYEPNFINYWKLQNRISSFSSIVATRNTKSINYKRSEQISRIEKNIQNVQRKMNVYSQRLISSVEASIICNDKLDIKSMKIESLDSLKMNFIQMCIKDLVNTGMEDWADMHANLLTTEYLKFILNNPQNFGANTYLKDEVISFYGFRCLNDCSGKGKCLKNTNCKLGNVCEKIVQCQCDLNYGSDDCSVNLIEKPIFSLVETCCDSKTMNCEKLVGIGPMFSTNDTLYYSLELVSQFATEDGTFHQGEATVIGSKRFEIKHPFGSLKNIKLSDVIMKVGISYGKGNYSYQNITYFDSTCRTCKNGVVDTEPLPGTCVSKKYNLCSIIKTNDLTCLEPSPCGSAGDIGFIIQTSKRSTESEFDMEKNMLSEITGRLNVGLDKVQLGLMYYSQRTQKILGFSLREQSNKKPFFLSKTQQIPYMPYLTSPLSSALSFSSSSIFSVRRESNELVPRLAVLVNDQSSGESLSSISAAASNLKNQGIEVFVVGIGEHTDMQQLNTIASDSSHVIKVENHQFIYEKINEITEKICKANAVMSLEKDELIKLGRDEFRYFKVSLKLSSFLEIEINEYDESKSNLYYSFSYQNPTLENSETNFKRVIKRDLTSNYLIEVPPATNILYLTIQGIEKFNQIKINVREIDL